MLFPLIIALVIAQFVQHRQSIDSKGATRNAQILISPTTATIPSDSIFKIFVDSLGQPVSFSRIEVKFDNTALQLTEEPLINSPLSRKITVSSMQEANSSGVIKIVLGLDPISRANPPSGVFQIAQLAVKSIKTDPNLTTQINFLLTTSQIVHPDLSAYLLSGTKANIVLNPQSPTPMPTPTRTPVSTLNPTPTPVRTTTPRPTRTPTPSPRPTATPLFSSCAAFCQSRGYTTGTCRDTSRTCRTNSETYIRAGNTYCKGGGPKADTCCCK